MAAVRAAWHRARCAPLLLLALSWAGKASADESPLACLRIQLPESSAPIIGLVGEVTVRIEVDAAVAMPLPQPPRLFASVGRVESLHGEGRSFTARYSLPESRFPQVVLLAAELPGSACRTLSTLPLRAPATPAFRTDPGASVTVRVGDRDFGPAIADERGQVRVAVVVPPGIRSATARSTNSAGRVTEQPLDLAPPPFTRLLILAPPSLQAGAIQEVAVAGIDDRGELLPPERLALGSSHARPHPLGGAPGLGRFLIRAPASLDERQLRLTAGVRGEPDTELEATLPLRPGPVTTLAIRPLRSRLPAAAHQITDVFVIGRDAHGNAAPADAVAVYVNGRRADTRSLGDGRVAAQVSAHEARAGHVEVEAVLSPAYSRERVPVLPERRSGFVADDDAASLTPRLGVTVGRGGRPGVSLGVEVSAPVPVGPRPLRAGLGLEYLGSRFDASRQGGAARVALDQSILLASLGWRLLPRSWLELLPTAGVGASLLRTRTEDLGYALSGWNLVPALQLGLAVATPTRGGVVALGGRYLVVHPGTMSSGDTFSGNAAGLVLELGYRVRL